MKKIGTITFHSSYNYGSNLQAYALQEYVKKLYNGECDYKIINLRTNIQKEMYKNIFQKRGVKNHIKRLFYLKHKKALLKKEEYYEKFINEKLNITKEYASLEELKKENFDFDYYISGSDQLWNLQARDFDWANYLEFVHGVKKISYAASWGPKPQTWNDSEKERAKKDLLEYKSISVREEGSFNNVKELLGIEASINVDPTMLLNKEDWNKIIDDMPLYKGKYIFLYNLKGDNEIIKLAKIISRKLKLPVVVSLPGRKLEMIYGFKRKFDVGPVEFLNLIKNAELVLSSSFHGTIFSILLQKPFFALKGAKDFRISTLLKKMDLQNRTIDLEDCEEKIKNAFDIDFSNSYGLLNEEREKSKKFLKKALEIDN